MCEALQRSFTNCEAWKEKQPVLEVSSYLTSDYSVCRNYVSKCVKPLHKVSPIFYFLIQTISKDFIESLSGLICRNDLLYLGGKCFLVVLFTGERAIFPKTVMFFDCYFVLRI